MGKYSVYEEVVGDLFPEIFEHERKAKSDHRVKNCGATIFLTIPTGYKKVKWLCKNFRECPNCRKLRIAEFKNRLLTVDKDIYQFSTPDETWSATQRRMKKEGVEYLCFPQDNGQRIVLTDGIVPIIADHFTKFDISDDRAIERAVIIPQGKRVSGNLGKAEEEPKEDYENPINVTVYSNSFIGIVDEARATSAFDTAFETAVSDLGITEFTVAMENEIQALVDYTQSLVIENLGLANHTFDDDLTYVRSFLQEYDGDKLVKELNERIISITSTNESSNNNQKGGKRTKNTK